MVKICLVTYAVLLSSQAISHSGRTDSSGCHGGSKPYHCHGGGSSGGRTYTPNTGRDTYTPETNSRESSGNETGTPNTSGNPHTPETNGDDYSYDTAHSSDTVHRHCAYGEKYRTGVSLAATVGFGLGHAVQCRWLHGGWIFTLSQLAAGAVWVSADNKRVLRVTKYIFFLSKFLEFLSALMSPKPVGETNSYNLTMPQTPPKHPGLQLSLHCPMPCTVDGLQLDF